MTKNLPILLINQFNGVSVANQALVLGFNQASLKLRVNKYQGVVLQAEHQTLMVTDLCDYSILAKVDYVNLTAREAYLTEFRFVEKLYNVREQVRIRPRHEIIASFPEISDVTGKVHDISTNGLGFFIPREDVNYGKFTKGAEILVEMVLPLNGGEKKVKVPCIIRKVFLESEESRLRIGLQTMPDDETNNTISTYITQNMLAICGELNTMYNEQVQEPIYLSNLSP
ncbi:MAG: PilZ domain-containing protein [Anaerolineaceae bacterium]